MCPRRATFPAFPHVGPFETLELVHFLSQQEMQSGMEAVANHVHDLLCGERARDRGRQKVDIVAR